MYIGPWQEYRLAKIQDDAIQRLRQEWEAQARGQPPRGEDDRIRDIMQPLVATLPSLLLATKSRAGGPRGPSGHLTESRSGAQSKGGSQCSSRPSSARSSISRASLRTRTSSTTSREPGEVESPCAKTNQETHDEASSRVVRRPPKPKKKGKKAPLTALEQVQKRKKMFATWIKQAGDGGSDAGKRVLSAKMTPDMPQCTKSPTSTRLPLIQSAAPASAEIQMSTDARLQTLSPTRLPPLNKLVVSDLPSETHIANQATALSPRAIVCINEADVTLEESVDEGEVNKLLDWTDTLLSPQAMDLLCNFDD